MCLNSSNSMRNYTLLIVSLILLSWRVEESGGAGDWCYGGSCGPKTWEGVCKTGKFQSPINISPLKSKLYLKGSKIIFNKNYNVPKKFFLLNNGHTVQVLLQQNLTSQCFLRGDGLLSGRYYLSQIHFHWGPNNRVGSEHRLGGYTFPLEMHMVHIHTKNAKKFAVLAIFFYLALYDNPNLAPIINNLPNVKEDTEAPVLMTTNELLNITNLLPKSMRMFRYLGSLTTPPCSENVIWTVFQEPVPVSAKQLAAFRKLLGHDKKPLLRTFRPVQPTYTQGRKNVYFMRLLKRNLFFN